MSFLDFLADEAVPPKEYSRWYCDRPGCDGEPHGEHWHWCKHPLDGKHSPKCRHARAAQVPPPTMWSKWLLTSGRGFGKSRAAAEWLIDTAYQDEAAEWCVIARSMGDVLKNARDLSAGLAVIAERDERLRQYNRHENDIYLRNGAIIHCLSADKPDKLRGYNLRGAWADEIASWRYGDAWDMLTMALRDGEHTRIVVTTTPKPVPLMKQLFEEAEQEALRPLSERSVVFTSGSTWDNAKNLAPNTIEDLRRRYAGTRIGEQELEGKLLYDLSGALVTPDMIDDNRLDRVDLRDLNLQGFTRIVVAVDPAGTYGDDADETGIVVCARDRDSHGHVLEDASMKGSPRSWAQKAANMYEKWQADCIVAEVNMGNALVEDVIRSVAPTINYKAVRAVEGKRLRAEPVTALYEQGRIHHRGVFPVLEDQLCSFRVDVPIKNTRGTSPDHMDALVHGFTELGLVSWGQGAGWLSYMQQQIETAAAHPERSVPAKPRDYFSFEEPPAAKGTCPDPKFFAGRCVNCGLPPSWEDADGMRQEHPKRMVAPTMPVSSKRTPIFR